MKNVQATSLILVIAICKAIGADLCLDISLSLVSANANKRITQDILWSTNKTHLPACLDACNLDMYCLSVQYSEATGLCEGLTGKYAGVPANEEPTSDVEPGMKLYETTKGQPPLCNLCSVPSCPTCDCPIGEGRFGSYCRRLTDCKVLNNIYTKFVAKGIADIALSSHVFINAEACKAICIADSRCLSFDHIEWPEACYPKPVQWWSEGADRRYNFDADHYQRGCLQWETIL